MLLSKSCSKHVFSPEKAHETPESFSSLYLELLKPCSIVCSDFSWDLEPVFPYPRTLRILNATSSWLSSSSLLLLALFWWVTQVLLTLLLLFPLDKSWPSLWSPGSVLHSRVLLPGIWYALHLFCISTLLSIARPPQGPKSCPWAPTTLLLLHRLFTSLLRHQLTFCFCIPQYRALWPIAGMTSCPSPC